MGIPNVFTPGTVIQSSQVNANFAACALTTGDNFTAFILPKSASAPGSPALAQMYWDTTLGYPRIYGADAQWHGLMLS